MKKLTCLMMAVMLSYGVTAQLNNYYNRMGHVFGAIDKNKVTTGYLKEFGLRLNEVEVYNGSLGATNWVDASQWKSLYTSLYTMRVGSATASMAAPASVYSHLESQQTNNPDVVLLAAQYYTYQQYKTNALSNGDVTVSNDRIYDVAGRNPYETKTAFAVLPSEHYLAGNAFAFKLQSNMIYTNTSKTLSSVQVDFGNGQGYQTITLNAIKNVTYSSGGEKELKVKFVYSGGPTLYSHSKLYVDYTAPQSQYRFDGTGATDTIITGTAWNGATASGRVTVELAPGHTQIVKPLIVVEGFDPFNRFDYRDFIVNNDPTTNNVGSIDIPISATLSLNQAIETEGYDLVFVDYVNSRDFIQRNALMVEAVIGWVNGQKVGNEKNVVMGMSMGALVARYALRHMELTGGTHETGRFISLDAPHQGANMPLAFQAMVRHLIGTSINVPTLINVFGVQDIDVVDLAPDLQEGLDILQCPAAQQMLIYQLSGQGSGVGHSTGNNLHQQFLTEYQTLGYPTQGGIKNIAISNGSECGNLLVFGDNALLARVNEGVDLPWFVTNVVLTLYGAYDLNPISTVTSLLSTNTDIRADFELRALPNQSTSRVYRGELFVKKKVLFLINVEEPIISPKTINALSAQLPLDNSGGGVYDINRFINLPAATADFLLEPRFNFVPTYSSLDIGQGDQVITTSDLRTDYSPMTPPVAPKNTPFANFFTNPTLSENHTQFTLNNGNWLVDELGGNSAFFSCASECSPVSALTISGVSRLCTFNSTFSVPNLPPGVTVNWSVTPEALFAVDNGTGATFATRATNSSTTGQGTITATINDNCGSATITHMITVGRPTFAAGDISGPSTLYVGSNGLYTSPGATNVGYYRWYFPSGGLRIISGQGTTSARLEPTGSTGLKVVEFRAYNECGYTYKYTYIDVKSSSSGGGGGGGGTDPCANTLAISPNPTSGDMEALVLPPGGDPCMVESALTESDTLAVNPDSFSMNTIERDGVLIITNHIGEVVYEKKHRGKKINLRLHKLEPGIYVLYYMYNDEELLSAKFIKQ